MSSATHGKHRHIARPVGHVNHVLDGTRRSSGAMREFTSMVSILFVPLLISKMKRVLAVLSTHLADLADLRIRLHFKLLLHLEVGAEGGFR